MVPVVQELLAEDLADLPGVVHREDLQLLEPARVVLEELFCVAEDADIEVADATFGSAASMAATSSLYGASSDGPDGLV